MYSHRYEAIFRNVLGIPENQSLEKLEYQGVVTWDSVGHMALIAALEEEFEVSLEMDDVIDFDSFETGKAILIKYDIAM